ncbi:MAG: hypothetical protein AB7K86_08360 [Rhodospirillales bacterium]
MDTLITGTWMDELPSLGEIVGFGATLLTMLFFVVRWLTGRLDSKEKEAAAERESARKEHEALKDALAEEREERASESRQELHLWRNKFAALEAKLEVNAAKLENAVKDRELLEMKIADLRRQLDDQADQIRARDLRIATREQEISGLHAQVDRLTAQVEALRRRLNKYEPGGGEEE